ncbi:MAG: beta-lactamase family protein, partial [Anaerolineaceae bacterium]|nr:beta-lactamase family protein [Anaerolineaceae bacterium]
AFGYADIKKEKPVTMDTVFRIMSISKTFTGFGIMQLWEQGKFDLDDPVNPHLKLMKVLHKDPKAPAITFRHLLTHTSGIGERRTLRDNLRSTGDLRAHPDTRILSMPEYYSGLLRTELFPGQKWAYANHGYAVLAQLIEDISGETFYAYMRRHVFEPLGMQKSDYVMSERVRSELAQGYTFDKDRFEPVPYMRLNTPGCGGIFSSVNEMARYLAAMMNGGENKHGSVIKPETLKMMMTSQLEQDERVFSMGLSFMIARCGPHLIARHGGGWPGFISEMQVAPDANLGVVVFNNSSSRAPARIGRDIMHHLLGVPDPDEKVPDKTILQTPAGWPELCGSYGPKPGVLTNVRVKKSLGGELDVYVKGRQLMARGASGPMAKSFPIYRADPHDPLFFKGKAVGQVLPILFHKNEDGDVVRLDIMRFSLYKRPLYQGVRYKTRLILGIIAGKVLFVVARKVIRKKKSKKC